MKLKMTTLACLALATQTVSAGTMGPVCQGDHTIAPCEQKAWDISGRALYVRTNSGLYLGPASMTAANSTVTLGTYDPWGWGFQLEGAYHFNTGNDLDLNWSRFHAQNSSTYGPSQLAYAYPDGTTIDSIYNSAYASVHPEWDQVNLEYGQRLDIGTSKFIRLHGGVQYSRVANSGYYQVINQLSVNGGSFLSQNDNLNAAATFNGFGPRVGTELHYLWNNSLNLYAQAAVAMLAGSAKSTFIGAETISLYLNRAIVAPEIDAKLGMTYSHPLAQGDLSVDAGWLWVNYFNTLITTNTPRTTASFNSDFGVQGVYFGLKWTGNIS